jgi:hypothetical protein
VGSLCVGRRPVCVCLARKTAGNRWGVTSQTTDMRRRLTCAGNDASLLRCGKSLLHPHTKHPILADSALGIAEDHKRPIRIFKKRNYSFLAGRGCGNGDRRTASREQEGNTQAPVRYLPM